MKKWALAFSASMLLAAGSGVYNLYQSKEYKLLRENNLKLAQDSNRVRHIAHYLDLAGNPLTVVEKHEQDLHKIDSVMSAFKTEQTNARKEIKSIKNNVRKKLLFPDRYDEMEQEGILYQSHYMSNAQRRKITQLNQTIARRNKSIDSLATVRSQKTDSMRAFIDSTMFAQYRMIEKIKELSK